MDSYRLTVLLHIVLGVVLTGQALYWFIMLTALRQKFSAADAGHQLAIVSRARWPHVVVPWKLRIPLSLMSWLTIALVVATGLLLLEFRPAPQRPAWWVKMGLLAAVAVVQLLLSRKPNAMAIRLNMALVLALMITSALAVR